MSDGDRLTTPEDGAFIRQALALAVRGWGQTAPNPMVGAVVVRDGIVVGEGWHARFGASHAEVEALRQARERARGATLYVTLEPCDHHGKTPPCTEAILAAGIRRVVAATGDPSADAGGGAARLRENGVDVVLGVMEDTARELNASFFHLLSSERAFVQLKLAISLDGGIADDTRQQRWLTGPESRREVHRLRAGADAIAVGIGTAIADDPQLTIRDFEPPPRIMPARVVFDRSARLPLTSHLARTARDVPTIVVCRTPDATRASALERAGVSLLRADSAQAALVELKRRGIGTLLVEGGAGLAGSLVQEALVDRLIIFRAPLILGEGALNAFGGVSSGLDAVSRWRIVETRRFGDDEMTVYAPPDRAAGAI